MNCINERSQVAIYEGHKKWVGCPHYKSTDSQASTFQIFSRTVLLVQHRVRSAGSGIKVCRRYTDRFAGCYSKNRFLNRLRCRLEIALECQNIEEIAEGRRGAIAPLFKI